MTTQIQHLSEIVENGLCMGCGLCQSIAGPDRVRVMMTPEGRERPVEMAPLAPQTVERIQEVCPGIRINGLPESLIDPELTTIDPIWGPYLRIVRGYAGDPEVRFKGSTGGALSALALYLVESGTVDFVLHVAASKQHPMRSERQVSFDRTQVLEGAGSRYGPAAPLVDFTEILEREQPFAFIGKPCDIAAIRNLARLDERVARYCKYCLTFFCGGNSVLGRSKNVLDQLGLQEEELSLFRYRGYGCPGPISLRTKDGRTFEYSYIEMWRDETRSQIQFRCKICPDAIGEGADIAVFDTWPGAKPTGEDEGYNGFMMRTRKGLKLLEAAERDGAVVTDQEWPVRQLDILQPHQARLKRAVWARLEGLRQAGQLVPQASGLRIEELARQNDPTHNLRETEGTLHRVRSGHVSEPPARPEPHADYIRK